ncbi:MAG: tRNA (adenosine(37)-N6)-threonylcarbamoyltransferase complex dimerization subunit type 1 TsaB [Cyanobacteria bacterium HKST-UBA06]|nr:tRNA (adenosine(37)-N6)-threonylcarbamoyltransferase complex dimerization subunit type 1 TsaB [Cyanobacteria bacterium HKST-UBA06]
MTKPLTLALDTTMARLQVGLYTQAGESLGCINQTDARQRHHSAVLLPRLAEMMAQHAVAPDQVGCILVNIGPGSFTGIRTGLTMVRIWAQVVPEVVCIPFNTFELLAAAPPYRGLNVTVLLNAYRQQHMVARLCVAKTGQVVWHQAPLIEPNAGLDWARWAGDVCLVEDSLVGVLPTWGDIPGVKVVTVDEAAVFTPAVMMALYQADHGQVVPWAQLLPNYVQQPHITQPVAKTRAGKS